MSRRKRTDDAVSSPPQASDIDVEEARRAADRDIAAGWPRTWQQRFEFHLECATRHRAGDGGPPRHLNQIRINPPSHDGNPERTPQK